MTNQEFVFKQDTILAISGAELATLLGTTPASVSRWRKDFPIPDTVANLLNFHVAEKLKTVPFPLSLTELFALSRLAEQRGQTIEELLVGLIRKAISPAKPSPDTRLTFPSAAAAPSPPDDLDAAIASHIKRHGTLLSKTVDAIGGDAPLHRDLKPENITLNEDSHPPETIDFGQRQPVTYKPTRKPRPTEHS